MMAGRHSQDPTQSSEAGRSNKERFFRNSPFPGFGTMLVIGHQAECNEIQDCKRYLDDGIHNHFSPATL